MNRHSQKGSALLIVLGFLSFMVVSAVAFAIWMRNERLPHFTSESVGTGPFDSPLPEGVRSRAGGCGALGSKLDLNSL